MFHLNLCLDTTQNPKPHYHLEKKCKLWQSNLCMATKRLHSNIFIFTSLFHDCLKLIFPRKFSGH